MIGPIRIGTKILTADESAAFRWREEQGLAAIKEFCPDIPDVVAYWSAIGVAAEEIDPAEFAELLSKGCEPHVAVDILKP